MSKRVLITSEELTNLGLDANPKLYIRYRLISEDRNRFSAWTPIFEIPNP